MVWDIVESSGAKRIQSLSRRLAGARGFGCHGNRHSLNRPERQQHRAGPRRSNRQGISLQQPSCGVTSITCLPRTICHSSYHFMCLLFSANLEMFWPLFPQIFFLPAPSPPSFKDSNYAYVIVSLLTNAPPSPFFWILSFSWCFFLYNYYCYVFNFTNLSLYVSNLP